MTDEDLPSLDSLDVAGKRVLVRCDLNVPLGDGAITDDLRIRAALPTLNDLLDRDARLAICSHLGRPKGKVVDELRLAPVGERLSELLERDVAPVRDVVGDEAKEACASEAQVVLLENLRFEPGETANDAGFADALASLADTYVNDAFGASHREHASIVGVPQRLPSAAGHLLVDEVSKLERLLKDPEHPYVAVLGGVKVSDKLDVIENLITLVDALCVGGAMAFTLLEAKGEEIGRSLVEEDRVEDVRRMLAEATSKDVQIHLPVDVVAAEKPEEGSAHDAVPLSEIGDRMGVDIGPETTRAFAKVIVGARTVLWNGPMGIFEVPDYSAGTRGVATAIEEATAEGAFTVAGGGDSAAALKLFSMTDAVSHLSTGGGASLKLLEGKELPGVAALRRKTQ
ncbi:MAG: phosphoglycerate kinase [Actinomycetota bacterium]